MKYNRKCNYRIRLTESHKFFYIEKRRFFFFWESIKDPFSAYSNTRMFFKTIEEAEEYIEKDKNQIIKYL